MFERIIELFERLVLAAEKIANGVEPSQVAVETPAPKSEPSATIEPEVIDMGLEDEVPPPELGVGRALQWDPRLEAVQGAYRTADKKEAIDYVAGLMGIEFNKSTNYVARHNAILAELEEQGEPHVPENDPVDVLEDPALAMTWEEFKTQFIRLSQVLGKQKSVAICKTAAGVVEINENSIKPELYKEILEAMEVASTATTEDIFDEQISDTDFLRAARDLSTAKGPKAVSDIIKGAGYKTVREVPSDARAKIFAQFTKE